MLPELSPRACGAPAVTARTRPTRPAQCTCCRHPERARIESAVIAGASQRSVGRKFGLDKDAMSRHFRLHVTRERKAELLAGPAKITDLANAAADESRSLLDELRIVRSVLFNQFLTAAEVGDRNGVGLIAGRLLESLDRLGRLSGELRELSGVTIGQINVFADPKFLALQRGLIEVARQHPEARGSIIALLRDLDSSDEVKTIAGPSTIECEAVENA